MRNDLLLKIGLTFISLLFLYSLYNRMPDGDDAWLGEHAYWQAKLGYVKSELMHGITMQEDRFLCHHKLLTLQGAAFIKALGFSIFSLKSVSFLYLLIFLFLFYKYAKLKVPDKQDLTLLFILFLANALVFEFSFVYRPEIPLMTLGFISFIFLEKGVSDGQRTLLFVFFSGLFAGLCFATHLNGIIFLSAGFLFLIWNKKYMKSLLFAASSVPSILIYFYDFTSKYNFHFWLYQLNETPSHERISNLPVGVSNLVNLLNEHQRFFHSPLEISISLMFLISFILSFRFLKGEKNLTRYTFLLMLSLSLIAVHKTSKYMIPYLPYLLLLLILSLKHLRSNNVPVEILKKVKVTIYTKQVIVFFILVYLSVNVIFDFRISFKKWDQRHYPGIVETYVKQKPENCRIVAPMTFIFDQITRFKAIQSDLSFSEMKKSDGGIFRAGFLEKTKSFNVDYMILEKSYVEKFGLNAMTENEFLEHDYQLLLKSDDLFIIERKR